ncbi:oxidoreductase [Paenarthrobacter nitroguajacolicus]|uniref:Oxidoreductase n=1 Tax=Paenarthrobacter nitroguajacolicus TaxID=211146 RepID=A0A558H4F0_PAENT|nr:oxidoreductase [Paenarthrobacter nitroguajacolicus]
MKGIPVTSSPTVRTLRVHQKSWEADGVTSLTLTDPSGAPLPGWVPGAHLSLRLPNGLTREYSLCSDPGSSASWTVAVLRTPDSRGGSKFVHDDLPVGSLLDVEGPRTNFSLEEAGSYVLVAGGVGITPIIAMARQLEKDGADWSLLYTGRSKATMAFLGEISAMPQERVTIHADDEANGNFPDIAGAVGSLGEDSLVYVCGPEPLMKAVEAAMSDPAQLRLERFKAPVPAAPPAEETTSFEVVCLSNGQRIAVGPDISVLDALNQAGINVPSSCTEGICGTCEVGVVEGDVDHRDFLLSPAEQAENKSMFVCVSRCRSRELVLNL